MLCKAIQSRNKADPYLHIRDQQETKGGGDFDHLMDFTGFKVAGVNSESFSGVLPGGLNPYCSSQTQSSGKVRKCDRFFLKQTF